MAAETAVLARYLTVGGATITITQTEHSLTAYCHGCPDADTRSRWIAPFTSDPTGPESETQATEDTAGWAQAHASLCRTMPKTDGEL